MSRSSHGTQPFDNPPQSPYYSENGDHRYYADVDPRSLGSPGSELLPATLWQFRCQAILFTTATLTLHQGMRLCQLWRQAILFKHCDTDFASRNEAAICCSQCTSCKLTLPSSLLCRGVGNCRETAGLCWWQRAAT